MRPPESKLRSIAELADSVLAHFDGTGFETLLWLPRFLTKENDEERWAWMLCDAPTLLYALLAFGYGADDRVMAAVDMLAARSEANGWRCGAADSLPRFAGPGRRDDTCPMATTYALKALGEVPGSIDAQTITTGCDALLEHWEHQQDYKLKMFGIGTDFRKLKYPYVWYDILHVTDVLSRHAAARSDPRLREMVDEIARKADASGRFTAESMYRAWTGWSFADKKAPSPWLTFLAVRTLRRVAG